VFVAAVFPKPFSRSGHVQHSRMPSSRPLRWPAVQHGVVYFSFQKRHLPQLLCTTNSRRGAARRGRARSPCLPVPAKELPERGVAGHDVRSGRQLWLYPWTNNERINVPSRPRPAPANIFAGPGTTRGGGARPRRARRRRNWSCQQLWKAAHEAEIHHGRAARRAPVRPR